MLLDGLCLNGAGEWGVRMKLAREELDQEASGTEIL